MAKRMSRVIEGRKEKHWRGGKRGDRSTAGDWMER